MAEAAENVQQMARVKEGQIFVKGEIQAVERFETQDGTVFEHRIIRPNPDPYGSPHPCEVRASRRLGAKGEEWQGVCTLGGFMRKPFKVVDRETGEQRTVRPVQMTLTAVE